MLGLYAAIGLLGYVVVTAFVFGCFGGAGKVMDRPNPDLFFICIFWPVGVPVYAAYRLGLYIA